MKNSTLKLLRIPFSFFLAPTYLFALSQVPEINWVNAILIFIILHFLIYPASNGYNSYMDRDTASIGGLENPPLPSRQLFFVTIALNITALVSGLIIGWVFTGVLLLYIVASKAYSYRRIRLKQYPYVGYLTVVIFQGAVTYWLVYYGSNAASTPVPWTGMIICSLLVGGIYPLTQIYQHRQDVADGVQTISYRLGYTGTFIFCAILYLLATVLISRLFINTQRGTQLLVIGICFVPVILYFIRWFVRVNKNVQHANFRNTMRMNWLAAASTNISFLISLIWR